MNFPLPRLAILTLGAALTLVVGCSDAPTSPRLDEPGPAGPSYNGFTMGSGNRGADTTTTATTQTAGTSAGAEAPADTTGRGGFTMGSGN